MRGQVPSHSRQNANEGDGHKEAGPAIPVLGGWDKSEEDFPENCQEVHNVIKAGWQAFLPALLLIIVTWQRQRRDARPAKHIHRTAASAFSVDRLS